MRMIKTYSELIQIPTFEERYRYLRIAGQIGAETFGCDRYLNQVFYTSKEWKDFRNDIIIRDNGCDLGIADRDIGGSITVHHIVPITIDDIRLRRLDILLNPENVICCSDITHKAIHYGDESLLMLVPRERTPYDTCPWKQF